MQSALRFVLVWYGQSEAHWIPGEQVCISTSPYEGLAEACGDSEIFLS